jgi:putative transposase
MNRLVTSVVDLLRYWPKTFCASRWIAFSASTHFAGWQTLVERTMLRFSPRFGLRVREGVGRILELTRRTITGKWEFEDEAGVCERVTPDEFLEHWSNRHWVLDERTLYKAAQAVYTSVQRDTRSLPKKAKETVKRRLRYILAVERAFKAAGGSFVATIPTLSEKISEVAKRLQDKKPPSAHSLWRWWSRFSKGRSPLSLVDLRKNSGRRRKDDAFGAFEEAVTEVLLNPQKFPIKQVISRLELKLKRINAPLSDEDRIAMPAKQTVYRWVNDLYYALVKRAREGKSVTERDLRIAQDSVNVEYILERVEIDHTPLDLMVIDLTTRLVLGRPWVTLAICRKSRCILGFYVSFNSPSAYAVMACIRRAILPKGDLLKQFPDIRHDWPCHGIMDLIVADNGMELHSNDIEEIAMAMAIEVQFCGVAMPQMKGAIERMFRTLAEDLIHQLPGTTFSNPKKRGSYPSEKLAAIDMATLVHLLVKWIVDVYHVKQHRGLAGKSPLEAWNEGAAQRVIELPVDPAELDVIISHAAHPKIFHYGVQIDNLFYNSPLLREITLEQGPRQIVEVRYREEDVGFVYVRDPRNDEFFEVPCTNQEYARGLNRAIHRLVVAQARKRFGDEWKAADLLQAREEIQAIVSEATKAKKTVDRKRAAGILMQDSEEILEPGVSIVQSASDEIAGCESPERITSKSIELSDDVEGFAIATLDLEEEFA